MGVSALPPVSVLIPLYNGIDYLPECLASVRAQTQVASEVLIGVNGHAVDSEALLRARALEDGRTRVLCYADLRSAPCTLNRLALEAQHEVVCLLDADDLWRPTKLEQQLGAWEAGHDVVGTFCEYFGERSGAPCLPAGAVPRHTFFRQNPMIHSSVMMRRADVRFREEFLYDYDLWLRLEASGRSFFNVAQTLTLHRVHRASAFNSQPNADARRRDLLRRHTGSRFQAWLAKNPTPLCEFARRLSLDEP